MSGAKEGNIEISLSVARASLFRNVDLINTEAQIFWYFAGRGLQPVV